MHDVEANDYVDTRFKNTLAKEKERKVLEHDLQCTWLELGSLDLD